MTVLNPRMDDYLAISALQHYAYCPRQFALIHVEQVWDENRFTAEGRILHERVDSPASEQRGTLRYERSVLLHSETYRLHGKMDLLEIHQGPSLEYFPVEYKRGKSKPEDWDRLQLCAQALCLEEMRNTTINKGAIWYWQVRRREPVLLDQALREKTRAAIAAAHQILASARTPRAVYHNKKCRACSLKALCRPQLFSRDRSARYIESMEI